MPTWSLGIEEQFYLLWPLVLSWAGRRDDAHPERFPRALKLTLAAVGAIILCKTALLLHDPGIDDKRIYFSSETRGDDSVLDGCCAALAWANPRLREPDPRRPIGHVDAVDPRRLPRPRGPERAHQRADPALPAPDGVGGPAPRVASVLVRATLILALIIHPTSGPARILSRPFMMWVGRLSYSIYLWHNFALEETKQLAVPIARALPAAGPGAVELMTDAVGVALGLALACLSYYVVERPFLRLKARFEPTRPPRPGLRRGRRPGDLIRDRPRERPAPVAARLGAAPRSRGSAGRAR